MENNENEIDKAFQKAIEGMEISPPDDVWNAVERDIFRRQNDSYRLTILWMKRAAMIAGIVIGLSGMVVAGYFINHNLNLTIAKNTTNDNSGNIADKHAIAAKDSLPQQDTLTDNHTEQVDRINGKINLADKIQEHEDNNSNQSKQVIAIEKNQSDRTDKVKTEIQIQKESIAIPFTSKNKTTSNQVKMLPEYEKAIPEPILPDKKEVVAKDKKQKKNTDSDKNNGLTDYKTETLISVNDKQQKETEKRLFTEKTEKLEIKEITLQAKMLQVPRKLKDREYRSLLPRTELASNTKKKQKFNLPSRFSATVLYSHDFNGRKLTDNIDRFGAYKQYFDHQENTKSTSTVSLRLNYDLSPKVSLQTGFSRTQIIQNIRPCWIPAVEYGRNDVRFTLFTSAGTTSVATEIKPRKGDFLRLSEQSRQSIAYIQIPVVLQYRFINRKFTVYSTTGLLANVLSAKKTNIVVPSLYGKTSDVTTNELQGLKKVSIGYQVGVGVEYNLYNKWSLVAEPVFKGTMGAINKSTPVSLSPYSLSINTGIKYQF